MNSIKLLINGKEYQVDIEDINSSPLSVTVNGECYSVEVKGGVAQRTAPAASIKPDAAVATSAKAAPINSAVVAGGANVVRAPMPGTVMNILVKAGEEVCEGQQLCSLEAMKMKSAIRTTKAGKIACVVVSEGQRVPHGEVLFTFE